MSLGINVTIPEGIVLAADSRQTYRNQKGMARIGSDSASILFRLGTRMGLIATGIPYIRDGDVWKTIGNHVNDFRIQTDVEKSSVGDVANSLSTYFETRVPYREQLETLSAQIRSDLERRGMKEVSVRTEEDKVSFLFVDADGKIQHAEARPDGLQFILAGFNRDGSSEVYMVYVPGKVDNARDSRLPGKEYGAGWIGQTDVVTRLVLGFDPRLQGIPLVREAASKIGEAAVQQQLRGVEYSIQWGTMNLQDAVDFCQLAIETTAAMQRFSDGVLMDPGDTPGVSGPVDIAIITYDKGFAWLSKKAIVCHSGKVDLDSLPDLGW
jgi:hypothetical protein